MNPDTRAFYEYLRHTYGIATAMRYRTVISQKLGTTRQILHQPKRKRA